MNDIVIIKRLYNNYLLRKKTIKCNDKNIQLIMKIIIEYKKQGC